MRSEGFGLFEPLRIQDEPADPATYLPIIPGAPEIEDVEVDPNDPVLLRVRELLNDYAGVIFVGPPGTSKSYYARGIARRLTDGHDNRIRYVQFHPSYQYEDFMQGYVPGDNGVGFTLRDKHLMQLCGEARSDPSNLYVMVIDELNRGDPGRVFGEALTYVERSKRGFPFRLASGEPTSMPVNVVFLATMNPLDRGVDEVDAAFERRFAKFGMPPNRDILKAFLTRNGMDAALHERVVRFFDAVQGYAADTPAAAIGQTFFYHAKAEDDLRRLWDCQLSFIFARAFRLNRSGFDAIESAWKAVLPRSPGVDASAASEGAAPPDSPRPPGQA